MPETVNGYENVLIFDTTLRDGAQSPGISLSTDQSLGIARQLSRLGVDIIEAGFPASSPGNFEAVQTIAREVEGPVIAALARAESPDIESAAAALRDADRPRIHTFISTSDIHIEHQMRSSREDVKGMARSAVAHARSLVEVVEFSPMDATRSDIEFTAEVCQIALDEGATTINIPDTVGYTQPYEYADYLTRLYELVPALGGVVMSAHCHDDLGLAVANSFAGVRAGARQVECAVNGLGERAGNCSLEEIAMLLRVRRDIDGFDTGIDSRELYRTSRMVSRYTGYDVQRNKAVVGPNAFEHEAGIHQAGVLNDRRTFEIMSAESIGRVTDGIKLGKQSGRRAVRHRLEEEGVFKPEHLNHTFRLFKDLADQVGEISTEQIIEIHQEAARRETTPYILEDYHLEASGKDGYSVTVDIRHNGVDKQAQAQNDEAHPGIDGPTSALFAALRDLTDTDFTLQRLEIDSIGDGEQTIGVAKVTLRLNGKLVVGRGVSLDTVKASGWAYLDAVRQAQAD